MVSVRDTSSTFRPQESFILHCERTLPLRDLSSYSLTRQSVAVLLMYAMGKHHQYGLQCPICLEKFSIFNQNMKKFKMKTCNCVFCTTCITAYFITQINDCITCIKCPNIDCQTEVNDAQLKICIGNELFVKFQRYRKIRNDSTFRECQTCLSELKLMVKS